MSSQGGQQGGTRGQPQTEITTSNLADLGLDSPAIARVEQALATAVERELAQTRSRSDVQGYAGEVEVTIGIKIKF